MSQPFLVTVPKALGAVASRCREVDRLALDVEANGLHAFRPQLCVVQVAWREGAHIVAAIIDALSLDLSPLSPVLGAGGPVKLLHDLTFDVRMLAERGLEVDNVRDTSVQARLLGERSTGLANLVSSRLKIDLKKGLQNHNWAERPFDHHQLEYLAGDVLHLHALDQRLQAEVYDAAITDEVEIETRYKLATAKQPPADGRPMYTRVKGFSSLAPVSQAVLRRLFSARDDVAEERDVQPHKIAPPGLLIELAKRLPKRASEVERFCRRHREASQHVHLWLEAVRQGREDGVPPPLDIPTTKGHGLPPEAFIRRKVLEKAMSRWRREAARSRGVVAQVIVPGHAMGPVVSALLESDDGLAVRLAAIPGLGSWRAERHIEDWRCLRDEVLSEHPEPPPLPLNAIDVRPSHPLASGDPGALV